MQPSNDWKTLLAVMQQICLLQYVKLSQFHLAIHYIKKLFLELAHCLLQMYCRCTLYKNKCCFRKDLKPM